MMLSLITSSICRGRSHCGLCRELSPDGEAFRESVAKVYNVEGRDFACPHGLEWIEAPKRPLLQPLPEPTAEQVAEVESLAQDQGQHRAIDICRACEQAQTVAVLGVSLTFCGSPLWPSSEHKTCGCFMDIKARIPGMHCPQGKW